MSPGRCSRAVRAALFAVACVLLAAVGHVLMSGAALPWWGVLSAFAGTVAAAWPLTARERSLPAVTGVSVAVQALLHTVFALTQPNTRPPLPTGHGTTGHNMAGHDMTAHGTAGHDMTAHGTAGHDMTAHDMTAHGVSGAAWHDMVSASGTGMLAAHLLAALLCGLWLAHAERAAFRLLRALAHRLRVPLRLLFALFVPVPRRPRARLPRDFGAHVLRGRLLAHSLTSRGPPAGTAVV
ncbi:hypothetical protein [Streptomyces bikiniensis]|uniref:hypothetical protein n=1 Tax=Streptomyces bikiniensis TaxID=1896 RepID=UPI0004C09984|nr:hypothetical protein [Streptomyces bikiniensis]